MISEHLTRALVLATALALAGTPLARRLAVATGFLDRPGGHKSHGRAVPYLGGVAIMVAVGVAVSAAGGLDSTTGLVLLVACLVGVIGLIDDRSPLHPLARLACQFLAAALICGAGMRFEVTGLATADWAISVLWFVAVTNAFNLLDNMDGLCAASACVAGFGIAGISLASGQVPVAVMAMAICGACAGFLAFNLRPATIHMGDAGSMFLGAALAALTLAAHPAGAVSVRIAEPFLIMGLPLLDTTTVLLGRARRGISVLHGGSDHLSHRLADLGMRRRLVLRTLLATEAVSVGAAVAVARGLIDPLVGLAVAGAPLAVVWLRASRARVYDDPVIGLPRRARWAIAGGGVLVLVVSAPAALAMARARTALEIGGSEVEAGIQHEESGNVTAASQDFALAATAFSTARHRLSAPVVRAGRVVPVLAVNLRAASTLAKVGVDLSRSGQELAVRTDVRTLRIQNGAIPLPVVAQLAPRLKALNAELNADSKVIHQLPRALLVAPLRRAVDRLDAKLASAARQSSQSVDAATMVPALLGLNGQRRYLLLFQNSAEARATGGLIGNFGELVADSGTISQGRFGRLDELNAPVGTVRSVPAPADYLARYAQFSPFDLWQNINLSPDFPTVGSLAAELYPRSGGSPVSGVIGVDPVALSDLLRLTGPIVVAPWPTAITADNVVEVTLQAAYDELPNVDRIAFLGAVARAVFAAVSSRDLGNVLQIAQALGPAVAAHHLQLYLVDPAEEVFASRLGADGGMVRASGDQWMVTTQNASANKVDYYLHRKVSYQLTLDPAPSELRGEHSVAVHGQLTVELFNGAPANGHSADALGPYDSEFTAGENRTFLSLYTPLLVATSSVDGRSTGLESGNESGLHVYSAFVDIPAGATRTVRFSLAGSIPLSSGGWYHLDLPRQPALGSDQLSVRLAVPSGWEIQTAPGASTWSRQADIALEASGPGNLSVRIRQTGLLAFLAPESSLPAVPAPTGVGG